MLITGISWVIFHIFFAYSDSFNIIANKKCIDFKIFIFNHDSYINLNIIML